MHLREQTLSSKNIYEGCIFTVTQDIAKLENDAQSQRDVIRHPGGVCVAALTDNDEILLVKQFRYPYGEIIYEIPAGKRNSKQENPLDCGIRELKEETGATAQNFIFLGELYPTPGYVDEVIYMYAATGLSFGDANPDEDEFLAVEKMPLDTLVEKIGGVAAFLGIGLSALDELHKIIKAECLLCVLILVDILKEARARARVTGRSVRLCRDQKSIRIAIGLDRNHIEEITRRLALEPELLS